MKALLICQVYRGSKKEAYLYVDKKDGLSKVPEALLSLLGKLEPAMSFVLNEDKKLARISAPELIKQLQEAGFYLQMPVLEKDEMQDVAQKNNKLVR